MHSKNLFLKLSLGAVICAALFVILASHDIHDTVCLSDPPATALLEDRYGTFLSEGSGDGTQEIGYWRLAEPIPPRIEACFLAIEDQRFYQHAGVDWQSVGRAFWNNLTGRKRQGASTIAMQVARMQAEGRQRTYWHKFRESLTALLLVRKFGHQAILKQYLELVPQGNRIHGVAYAARRYFRKPLQDLSWAETAVLAALPKAPGSMNLFREEGRTLAFARAKIILKQLYFSKTLAYQDFLAAQRQLRALTIPAKETRPSQSYHAILRLEEVLRDQTTHISYTQPIRACLNLSIQEKVNAFANLAISHYRGSGAGNIAVMVVEKETGRVVAYLGSDNYYNADHAGAINYARVRRSSGSTLKPFIYALGLETNQFTPASLLSDMPILVSLPKGYYRIGNYDDRNLGLLLYRKALANSRNVPAIHVLVKVGIDNAYELFRQLGLTDNMTPASYYGVGLAIGTLYVTLEDLVTAYGVLANDGKSFRLRWFEQPTQIVAGGDRFPSWEGQGMGNRSRQFSGIQQPTPIPSQEGNIKQIISQTAARQISLFLSDPLARLPTFQRLGPLDYPFPVAVKTGTSQGFRDAWAIAYSAKYLVGVWIGHPENTRMKDVSGADAAQVVKNIMLFLHPQEWRGVQEQRFAAPEGYTLADVCATTGGRATTHCPEVIPEYFRPGTEPVTSQPVTYASGSYQDAANEPRLSSAQQFPLNAPLMSAMFPLSVEQLLNASISIREPVPGGIFMIDPDLPRTMQTLSLSARVSPNVPEITWHVDGQPFATVAPPYIARWPITPGKHTIQASFAHAAIVSEKVTITVYQ